MNQKNGNNNKKTNKNKTNLVASLNVFHSNKLLGLLVSEESGHSEIAGTQIFDHLILVHL